MEIKDVFHELFSPKNTVFFSDKGLTSTEASHKSNLITERLKEVTSQFENTGAYKSELIFENDQRIRVDKNSRIENIKTVALIEGDMYALTAWFREAITAKDYMLSWTKNAAVNNLFLKGEEKYPLFGEQYPLMPSITPIQNITSDDVIGSFSIADRAEYLALGSKAAHLGKKIHKGGEISKIRRDLQRGVLTSFVEKPNGIGMKTYVVEHSALYDGEAMETTYFELQEQHRTFEARLNHFRAQIADQVTNNNSKALEVYNNNVKASNQAFNLLVKDYNDKLQIHQQTVNVINTGLEKRRLDLTQYISGLKIIIPKALENVIEEIELKK